MTEAASMNWSREFDEPIALPDGGELRTLLDAGRYVDALPRSRHAKAENEPSVDPELVANKPSSMPMVSKRRAAPLIEATRQQFQQQLAAKDADIAKKQEALRAKQEQLARDLEAIEDQVAARLRTERSQIVAAEGKKARKAAAAELESKSKELTELQQEREQDKSNLRRPSTSRPISCGRNESLRTPNGSSSLPSNSACRRR